ncbi:MAG: FUSC family protein [Oscillospiraceae bacterium]|nr:FUSC family protein [Oscillospiraceae bacterium]
MTRDENNRWRLPHLGQRIVKTTVAVFLCLIVYYLRGYHGADMPTESTITAIICMQPYVRDSGEYAVNRFAGTLIGAALGLLFLLLLLIFPQMGENPVLLYGRMALGVLLSLYLAVLVGKADASSLAAIVFLCVVVSFPDIEDPIHQAIIRMLDVFIGTLIAIGVNLFRLPRIRRKDRVFFIRTKDLVPDRFSPITPAALYRLNYLYDDGAKICLMSEHAPAFFMLQMQSARLSMPLIVMDGAAIFDAAENRYLEAQTIAEEDSELLRRRLSALGMSYFIYTLHNNKTCIFHRGHITELERPVYERMKGSPYRSYLEGEIYDPNEIVYIKVIADESDILDVEYSLRKTLPKGKLRAAVRPQAGSPGVSALYIYSHTATMEQAQARLMKMLREKDPELTPEEIRLPDGYRSERDAMHLLNMLGNSYEPISLFRRRKQSK